MLYISYLYILYINVNATVVTNNPPSAIRLVPRLYTVYYTVYLYKLYTVYYTVYSLYKYFVYETLHVIVYSVYSVYYTVYSLYKCFVFETYM